MYIAVAILSVGMCLNLVLTYGIIRRLREHTASLSNLASTGPKSTMALPLGAEVPEFTAVTTDGLQLGRDWAAVGAVVGFFAPNCAPCKEQVPLFLEYAASHPGGRAHFLAVVTGPREASLTLADQLSGVSQVAITDDGDHNTDIAQALGGHASPTFLAIEDGTVRASGHTVAVLPALTLA